MTKERREASFSKSGYTFEKDPRFSGEQVALGFDGVGYNPCDSHNRHSWLMVSLVPKPPARLGRDLRRKVN